MSTWTGTADVLWDATQFPLLQPNAGGTDSVGSSAIAVLFYPEGEAGSTDKLFGGFAVITGLTVNASYDGLIEASISFQGSGPLYYQTNA
jgi:hypothetical protein